MFRTYIWIVIVILLPMMALDARAEQITFTLSAGSYQIEETGGGFDCIDMAGFNLRGEPGTPLLPSRQYHFALPAGAQVTAVRIRGDREEILDGVYRIQPAPGIISLDGDREALGKSQRDWQANYDATYLSDEPFPQLVVENLGMGGLRKYTLLRLAFFPFSYRPVSGQLQFCPRAIVEVDYQLPLPGTEAYRRVEHALADQTADERGWELLDNVGQARSWYGLSGQVPATKSTYDYVVITTTGLVSALSDLVNWKEEIGYSVNVVTTDWISSNYSGSDVEEQIRNFLVDKYTEWGIEYVLLAGNIDVIPMRYCYPEGHSNAVPTDYYYADLTGNWDADADGYYGEPGQDAIDFLAEVYVGRIPYSDSSTLADICDKLVATESDTGSWKDSALLLGAFITFANEDRSGYPATDGGWVAQCMKTDIFSGWNITTMYEKSGLAPSGLACDYPLTNSNVINQWSTNDYGIVAWAAHGSSDAAWRKYWNYDDGDGVPETRNPNEMSWPYFFDDADTSSLDDEHPAIVFCASCENGHPEAAHLARALIRKGSAGAVAATRVSYGIIGWTQRGDGGIESLSYYFHDYLVNQQQTVGAALYNSKYFCWTHNWQNHQNMYDFCLYGDPALRRPGMAPTPQVVATVPQPNVYLASSAGNVTIQFDRPMDAASVNDTTLLVSGDLGGRYSGVVTYDPNNLTATINPNRNFLPGEPIWIQVTSSLCSGAGTPIRGGHSWSFRVLAPGGSGIFEDAVSFGSDLDPSDLCPGDFDGDGHVDLAVANLSLDNVSLWINDGVGSFILDGTYGVGAEPRGLVVGDLDGDGSLDLVTADSSDHQVSVLLNNGDGTFLSSQPYGTSQRPIDVVVADLDGDGYLDVAVACSRFGDVSVLLNQGDGTLSSATNYDVGNEPRAICTGDLNGDGHPDLVTANFGSDDVSILFNGGDGTFAPQVTVAAGDGPAGLYVAQLNEDGLPDAIVADQQADGLSVFINDGTGNLSLDSSYIVGDQPVDVCVADLDGDEDGDLVLACAGSDQVSVFRNRGDGTFVSAISYGAGKAPVSISAADFDGDGDPEIAAANATSDDISLFFNIDAMKVLATSPDHYQRNISTTEDVIVELNSQPDESTLSDSIFIICGSQTGRHWGSVGLGSDDTTVVISPTASFAPGEVVTSMLTTELKSDIGIPMNNGYGWSFFVAATGEGQFTRDTSFAAGSSPQGIAAADLNGDGLVDLATANYLASSVGVFINLGNGSFERDSLYRVNYGPVHVCPLDLEGDGDLDLASVNAWDYTVSVLRNQDGVFSLAANYLVGRGPNGMCAADLNGDGAPDLVVTNAIDDDISILFNSGDGNFPSSVRYQAGDVPWGVSAGDVDADGDFDLLIANWMENTFSVLINKGNGLFLAHTKFPVSGKPKNLTVGELNGDGHLDVTLSSNDNNLIMVTLGLGDGSFEPDSAYQMNGQPMSVCLVDIDGDGDQDLSVTRATVDSLTILKNDGNGLFVQRQSYPVGKKPMGLCALDADGDDALDLVVSDYDDDLLTIWYNTESTWPPAMVSYLAATLADNVIHLSWAPVTSDQMGHPIVVDHYTVYRQVDPYFIPFTGDSLGSTAQTWFDDTNSGLKNPLTNHYYVVKAVDPDGRKSAASATVGEFDICLQEAAEGKIQRR